jgi:hypothetical protein
MVYSLSKISIVRDNVVDESRSRLYQPNDSRWRFPKRQPTVTRGTLNESVKPRSSPKSTRPPRGLFCEKTLSWVSMFVMKNPPT